MNKTDVRSGISDIVAQVLTLPADQVPDSADFYDDLDGDSLQKLEVIARIEATFGCALGDEQAASSNTVAELTRQVLLCVA
jgi:acyl carrier protein